MNPSLSISFSPFPTLAGKRILLREMVEADAHAILKMRSNVEVMRYLDREPAKSLEDALEYIKKIQFGISSNSGITWAIADAETDLLVGTIGFWRIDVEHYRGEIGYMLQPEHQGKGLMQEAMELALDYAFTQLKLHSIEANVNPDNLASKKILERNGFVQEAYFRENYFYNNRFIDSAIYSLISPLPFHFAETPETKLA